MGINTQIYAIYGAKISYNSEFTDYYFERDDHDFLNNGNLIFDGMGGKYIILGKVLFSYDADYSEGSDNFSQDIFDRTFLASLTDGRMEILERFKNENPEWFYLFEKVPWKLHIFPHYS